MLGSRREALCICMYTGGCPGPVPCEWEAKQENEMRAAHVALAEPATRYASNLQPHCGLSDASRSTTTARHPLLQRARRFASSRPASPQRRCRSRASPTPATPNGPGEAPQARRGYREGTEMSFGCGSSLRLVSTVGSRTKKNHRSLNVD